MYGAIIGDLAGSIYEYDQIKKIKPVQVNEIINENSFYSDDTILTIAIIDAILNNRCYEKYLKLYIKKYSSYKPKFHPYFNTSFSPGILKWSNSNYVGTSIGNGAMMRISPIGYLFNTEEEVIENSYLATLPSHNSKQAIDMATKVALIIYYVRKGLSLEEIYIKLHIKAEYVPFLKFNTTCDETIGNCLYVLYNSTGFEDAIRKIISLGGDTDTNACIVGSIAEALYGIDNNLINQLNNKIPEDFKKILSKAYLNIKKL